MSRRLWLDHWTRWVPPLVLLLLGSGVLVTDRLVFTEKVDVLRDAVAEEQERLDRLVAQRRQLEDLVARAEASREGIRELYRERFGTESERLTELIREVKQLAERAGLRPSRIGYPDAFLDDYSLVERSINFNVEGDYARLRRFVNFLELTDSFVALRGIQVRGTGGALSLNLSLSTLFTGRDAAPPDLVAAAEGGA